MGLLTRAAARAEDQNMYVTLQRGIIRTHTAPLAASSAQAGIGETFGKAETFDQWYPMVGGGGFMFMMSYVNLQLTF